MRLTVELDGKPTVVDVSDDLGKVTVGERSYPVRVLARSPLRVELEIGGESVVVAGWPDHAAAPPGPVDVNGERRGVLVRVESSGPPGAPALRAAGPVPGAGAAPAGAPSPTVAPGSTPILPPMPGRVVEVRVREGERVTKGTVLLVLEAMKMRNEVTAPVDGVVTDLRAQEGMNVRARETMLVLVPK